MTIAALSTVAFVLAGTIPRRPPYHFRSPYTYTVQSDTGDKHRANVSGVIEASVLSILLFGWVTPVVRNGSTKDQLELDDLPHLDASFRTVNLYRKFRSAVKASVEKHQAKNQSTSAAMGNPPRDGLGYAPRIFNRLLWRVLVVNKKAFIMNCTLAFVTATLYYLPAFFLQKVVSYLEVSNEGKQQNRALGFAYCFGLLLALLLDAITTSALWYISTVQLASRIRVQLNAILFAKTLKVENALSRRCAHIDILYSAKMSWDHLVEVARNPKNRKRSHLPARTRKWQKPASNHGRKKRQTTLKTKMTASAQNPPY